MQFGEHFAQIRRALENPFALAGILIVLLIVIVAMVLGLDSFMRRRRRDKRRQNFQRAARKSIRSALEREERAAEKRPPA